MKPASVTSRFVSQSELEAARSASQSTSGGNQDYDPRSLFERLQEHKEAKDAKYDEMFKLSNQFRGIDEGESEFLAGVAEERKREEEQRRRREREEVEAFRAMKSGKAKATGEAALVRVEREKKGSEAEKEGGEGEGKKKEGGEGKKQGSIGGGGGVGGGKKKRKATSSLLGVMKKKSSSSTTSSTSSNGEAAKAKPSTTHTPASTAAPAQPQTSQEDSTQS